MKWNYILNVMSWTKRRWLTEADFLATFGRQQKAEYADEAYAHAWQNKIERVKACAASQL